MPLGVFLRDRKRGARNIGRHDFRIRDVYRKRYGDAARACAHVNYERRAFAHLRGELDRLFDEELRFRPGDERIRIDNEVEPVKFLVARDVLQRLARRAPVN